VGMRRPPLPPALVADLRAVIFWHGYLPTSEISRLAPLWGHTTHSLRRLAGTLRRWGQLPPIDTQRMRDATLTPQREAVKERAEQDAELTPEELARRCAEVRAEWQRRKPIEPSEEAAFRRHYVRTEVARMRGWLYASTQAKAAWKAAIEKREVA
jgi:hypothetical protein